MSKGTVFSWNVVLENIFNAFHISIRARETFHSFYKPIRALDLGRIEGPEEFMERGQILKVDQLIRVKSSSVATGKSQY